MEENFKNAFYHLNSMKRHLALLNMERAKQVTNRDTINFHEMKSLQFMLNLELALRALQKESRESEEE